MARITNEVIVERIENFRNYVTSELTEIKQHASATNGKVAKAIVDISNLETKQLDCPARKDKENGVNRQWVQWITMIIVSILSAIIAAVSTLLSFQL